MITFSFPFAILAILFRRFLDSFHPTVPVHSTITPSPNTTGLFLLTSALFYLYKHLKRGTLVRIATQHRPQVANENSNCRPQDSSWLLRNLKGSRNKYTVAIGQFAAETMKMNAENKLPESVTSIGRIHYHLPASHRPSRVEPETIQSIPITPIKPSTIFSASQRQIVMMEDQTDSSIGDKKNLSQSSSSSTNSPIVNVTKKSDLNVIEIIDLTADDHDIRCPPGGGDLVRRRGRKRCGKRTRRGDYYKKLRIHNKIASSNL